jgi:hypothetical protein
MRLKLFGATVLSLGILAGACANASTGDGPSDGGAATGSTGSTPPRSDELVLRIEQVGGFVPVQYNLTRLPVTSIYGDGLVITPGAQIDIYPGPALPALAQQHLTPDAVQRVIDAAIDAGLDKERDLRTMTVSDAPTTVFTLIIDGQTYVTQVYALDFDPAPKPDAMTQEEFQARKDLADFQKEATDLRWLPEGSVTSDGMYEPTALRIYSSTYEADPNLPRSPVVWPLTPGLDLFGGSVGGTPDGMRCGTVAADAAATLLPLAEQADQLTPWESDGIRYGLLFRPLLPDESGC